MDTGYVWQKAELDAEQRRHEMEADGSIFEMEEGGGGLYQEMPGDATRLNVSSLGRHHELRGEEYAKELDSSQEC